LGEKGPQGPEEEKEAEPAPATNQIVKCGDKKCGSIREALKQRFAQADPNKTSYDKLLQQNQVIKDGLRLRPRPPSLLTP